MQINKLQEILNKNELTSRFQDIYVCDNTDFQTQRYLNLIKRFTNAFKETDCMIMSAPGRTEVGGNHTDHQKGRVLAASVNMDMVAVVSLSGNQEVIIESEGFTINPVNINDHKIYEHEKYTSEALIRGIAVRFKELGYQVGGFHATMDSSVLKGSGISSSAAFEVLVGTIFSHLYNDGKVDPITIAQIGQYAENVYFDKPCGLMDQMASSVGGFVYIDFKEDTPQVEKVDFDFKQSGLTLCLVDTKGSHSDLSEEYGTMPNEMKEVAQFFHASVLSEISLKDCMNNLSELKKVVSDRCLLRAIHFFNENERVVAEVKALREGDCESFKKLVIESGYSSFMYLQNVYSPSDITHQELSVALAISEEILKGRGAYRVHGGGLAGTIQAFVPQSCLSDYISAMEALFGLNSCHCLSIRPFGGIRVI